MAQVPDITQVPNDGTLYSTVVGYLSETEMYNPDNHEWTPYEDIPDRMWMTLDCFIQFRGKIYHVENVVTELDPQDWSFTVLGDTPDDSRDPRKCAGTVIGGSPGIFTRDGYFFNLRTLDWEQKAPPPDNCEAPAANAMWSFQGKPTIFGAPYCDAVNNCYYSQIVQYQPEYDEWTLLGDMTKTRRLHEVVEVPNYFCDLLEPATTTTSPDTSPSGKTDTSPSGETDTSPSGETTDSPPHGKTTETPPIGESTDTAPPTQVTTSNSTTEQGGGGGGGDDGASVAAASIISMTITLLIARTL